MQSNYRRTHFGTLCAVAFTLAVTSIQASAAMTSVTASGVFQQATGTYSSRLNDGYTATFVFDSDASAASWAQTTPSADPNDPFTAVYGFAASYSASISSSGGLSISSLRGTEVRIIDNHYFLSADLAGLVPDGTYDLIEISGGTTGGVCLLPNGCSSPAEYVPTGGQEFGLSFVLSQTWLSGGALPNALPGQSDILASGVWVTQTAADTSTLGDLLSTSNNSITVSTVPVPAAAWLLGSGLLGLIGVARRKAA